MRSTALLAETSDDMTHPFLAAWENTSQEPWACLLQPARGEPSRGARPPPLLPQRGGQAVQLLDVPVVPQAHRFPLNDEVPALLLRFGAQCLVPGHMTGPLRALGAERGHLDLL